MDTSENSNTINRTAKSEHANNVMYEIFSKSNIVILIWFLAIYFVLSFIIRLSTRNTTTQQDRLLSVTRMFDFITLSFVLIILIVGYFLKTEQEKEDIIQDTYNSFVDYIDHPASLFSVGLFILALYIAVMLLGIPMDQLHKPMCISIIEGGAWLLFAIILIVSFFKYVLNVFITDLINKWFNDAWRIPQEISGNTAVSGNTVSTTETIPNEVFNIANNIYTFDDAQAVCKSYNARLATYDEIEDAYKVGGEWCNYGWSENQSIYFPTQKTTWEKLQKTPNHKNDCGRPGVNGGYMENPKTRFGVNCYGVKPKPSENELQFMTAKTNQPAPKTREEEMIDLKVKLFKEHKDELMLVNGFNNSKWSVF
jgi:hypothetical protein